jgi:hypothetical protein
VLTGAVVGATVAAAAVFVATAVFSGREAGEADALPLLPLSLQAPPKKTRPSTSNRPAAVFKAPLTNHIVIGIAHSASAATASVCLWLCLCPEIDTTTSGAGDSLALRGLPIGR